MPNIATITVNDGKATPVAHAFQPLRAYAGVAELAEPSSDGSLTKRNQLQFTQKLPGKGRSTVLEQFDLVLPHVVTEVVNGVSREIIHSNVRVHVQVVSHPEVPSALLKDARVLASNIMKDANVALAFDDRVGFS